MNEEPKSGLIAAAKRWYKKFERPISSISLIGGFVFDAVTLTRVDEFKENLWVVVHLAIVGACIILINRKEDASTEAAENPDSVHFWLVNILQFFFGGLLSTYLVFYFRSGTIAGSWPFLLILAAAFIANESLKKHYTRLVFQISLFFLSLYAFAIYLMPILFHQLGTWVFISSGIVSLAALWVFVKILGWVAGERFVKSRWLLRFVVVVLIVAVNACYFLNLIPPIPLSLKDAGIYHSLVANAPGNYTVTQENKGWFSFFDVYEKIHITGSGDSLIAYSAVFSPTSLDTDILHVWQTYDSATRKWITRAKISLSVLGGRGGGYRTYSELSGITPGLWLVNVETPDGKVIGALRFNAILATSTSTLETISIQ